MVIAAVDRFTIESAKVKTYSDFLTDFDKNPSTGYLALVTNEDAVRQSIRNLVLTERTERFYRSATGSKVYSLLFEPFDALTSMAIENTIRETIKNSEPRALVRGVKVIPNEAQHIYIVGVVFSLINAPEEIFETALILRRVR